MGTDKIVEELLLFLGEVAITGHKLAKIGSGSRKGGNDLVESDLSPCCILMDSSRSGSGDSGSVHQQGPGIEGEILHGGNRLGQGDGPIRLVDIAKVVLYVLGCGIIKTVLIGTLHGVDMA